MMEWHVWNDQNLKAAKQKRESLKTRKVRVRAKENIPKETKDEKSSNHQDKEIESF